MKFATGLLLALSVPAAASAQSTGATVASAVGATTAATAPRVGTHVAKQEFGTSPKGEPVTLYTLRDARLEVKLMTFGAHINSIQAPDRTGKRAEVILGFDTLDGFVEDTSTYMGSVVGRYGNRIANGTFSLDGKPYTLPKNNGMNMLHGGTEGFDRRNWAAKQVPNGVEFTLVSPDGDQGFPGTLTAHVRYTLLGDALTIGYTATTDKPTVLNLTNHTYFNLAGGGSIADEFITINADRYTPVDANLIPTGVLAPVAGTSFDFVHGKTINLGIDASDEQIKIGSGYDHNFVLNGASGGTPRLAARVVDPTTGRELTVLTTEPGVQFYTANSLKGPITGHGGAIYQRRDGLCLETQHFPDSPNHPDFPTTTLRPGQTFRSTTIFRFSIAK